MILFIKEQSKVTWLYVEEYLPLVVMLLAEIKSLEDDWPV